MTTSSSRRALFDMKRREQAGAAGAEDQKRRSWISFIAQELLGCAEAG